MTITMTMNPFQIDIYDIGIRPEETLRELYEPASGAQKSDEKHRPELTVVKFKGLENGPQSKTGVTGAR
jgi:hypothetical protein